MDKTNNSVWLIFFKSLKIYCLNIHKFLLYMAFPVLGQLFGIFWIFGLTYLFTQNLGSLTVKYPILNNLSTMITCNVIIVIPGLFILMKAFWDYLVAYGALNSMTEGYLSTGKVYDFRSHNEVVLNKTFSFIVLWLLFSIFIFLSIIPVFWILGFIFFIYFILIFQVFTFENGLSPIGYFRRSLELIKGNFSRTFLLATILAIFCFYLLGAGISVIFDYFNLIDILSKWFENWIFTLPIEPLEPYGVTPIAISKTLVKELIFFISAGFTLPLRSISWTLWYNNFTEEISKEKTKKRTTSKTAKTFRTEKKEIDPEIIRRARLEDDEY